MLRGPLFISFLLLISIGAFAQANSFSISGAVVDSTNGTAVELASVVLRVKGSNAIITGATAEADGTFEVKINKAGKYELVIAFMGYNEKILPVNVNANVKLGKILLSPSVSTLKEAVITAERPEISVTAEKTVFNVAGSPSSQVGTADDLLRNIPGVTVDQNGNISIIGKQGVKVLVDGRPNAQADNDLPNFLKSLPANSIESIEVITSPSAKYDAEGNAGIINIKLKKGKANGLNMSVSIGYGIINRYNGNLNINYRKNKFNIFGNYSANQSKTGFTSTANRIISVNDTTTYYNYLGTGTQTRFSNNLKAGFDYYPDDKTSITYTAGGNYSHSNNVTNSNSASLDAAEIATDTYNGFNQYLSANYTISNSLAYDKKFDSTDRELDAYVSQSYVGTATNTELNSFAYDSTGTYDPTNSLFQRTNSPNSLQDILFKIDYTHPLRKLKGYKIEAGLKNETTLDKNVFSDYNIVNNAEQFDTLLSNKFKYLENIAAAYGILRGTYKKWLSYSGGLRVEQTYISGNYNAINKDYIDFFPSASASVAFNDTQNLSLSYNRRIQRPPFHYINNAVTYTDQFTIWQGNPLLQPSYSNNISLAYSHTIKKHFFVVRGGGTIVNNGFTNIASVDSNRITRGTEANGANSKSCNMSLYVRFHITDWWEFQTYINVSYTYYGFSEGINLNPVGGGSANLWGMMRFKFWKNAALEVSGWSNTRNVNPQGAYLPVGALYASLKKSFLKDHLTVSFAANDILNSMKWRTIQDNTGIQSSSSWLGTNRYLTITLSYRFGSHDLEERKQKEENERIAG